VDDSLVTLARNGLGSSSRDVLRAQRWIEREPRNPHAYAVLGSIRAARQQHEEACALWREAIRHWGKSNALGVGSLRQLIAEARVRLGQRGKARREFAHAARAFKRARGGRVATVIKDDSRLREATCLAQIGQLRQAARLLQRVHRGPNRALFEEEIRVIMQQVRGQWPAILSRRRRGR
jgi:tetratricopeptide (TPR) repeat protein